MNEEQGFRLMAESGVGGALSLNQDEVEDRTVNVQFFYEPVKNDKKSREAGRLVCEDVEYYEIRIPGDRDVRRGPVTDRERQKFPRRYAAFKAQENQDAVVGLPLKEWPLIESKSMVEELRFVGVRTVEHLAGLSDQALKQLGPGWLEWRTKAQDWLKKADAAAPLAKLRAENTELRQRLETLEQMLQKQAQALQEGGQIAPPKPEVDLQALIAEGIAKAMAAQPPKKKPGRPPKIKTEE